MNRSIYYADTDTLYLVLTDNPVAETRDMGDDFVADVDADDSLVAQPKSKPTSAKEK